MPQFEHLFGCGPSLPTLIPTSNRLMTTALDPKLFDGLCVYQDVVVQGQTTRRGQRDCSARWQAIAPFLPRAGTLLDVGSNVGWFGLKWCELAPRGVVASVEADPRSAAVQREVLESNGQTRVCLLTTKADAALAQ